jgi:hypothetical protein
MIGTITDNLDPKLDLVLARIVDVPPSLGLGCLDDPRAREEVVHAGAMADRRLRNRPAPRRRVSDRHALA